MAETYNTLNHLVQINDRNLADLEVTDLLDDAPLLKVLYTQTASQNTVHKYLKQTVASAAAFRAALDGVTNAASQDELVTVTLQILDGSFHADVALADAYKDGRGAYLQREMFRKMRQIFSTVEKQVIYGVGNDAKGFIGLHDGFLNALSNAMVTTPGKAGSTANSQTSVYFIRHGRDDVSLVLGNDGKIVVEDEPTIQRVAGSVSGTFPALYVPVTGYIGLQLGSAYSSARIANGKRPSTTTTSPKPCCSRVAPAQRHRDEPQGGQAAARIPHGDQPDWRPRALGGVMLQHPRDHHRFGEVHGSRRDLIIRIGMAGRSENGRLAEPERTKTMKKILIALAVLAWCSAYAAQKATPRSRMSAIPAFWRRPSTPTRPTPIPPTSARPRVQPDAYRRSQRGDGGSI